MKKTILKITFCIACLFTVTQHALNADSIATSSHEPSAWGLVLASQAFDYKLPLLLKIALYLKCICPDQVISRKKHHTLLHEACKRNLSAIAEVLIQYDADVNAVTTEGKTPLDYAQKHNNPLLLKLLIQHNARNGKGFQAS